MMRRWCLPGVGGVFLLVAPAIGQEPVEWGPELEFHTFSIVAIDRQTGESGVAVTTRRPCVGNAVPWVRPGVGAVATQGGTRLEYGEELLDLLERGVSPQEALDRVVAADSGRERRQVGVIDMQGRSAQWTGSGQYGAEARGDWVAERSGSTFAVQGNSLVSTAVVDAVSNAFQAIEGSRRHLGDRLIAALDAGHLLGGDGRHGDTQSAAVLVADPRPGMSQRPDRVTVDINVCEHPAPVREVRRICDTISENTRLPDAQAVRGPGRSATEAGAARPRLPPTRRVRAFARTAERRCLRSGRHGGRGSLPRRPGMADRGRRIRRREDDLIGRYRHRSSTACSKRRVDRRNGSRNTWASIRMPQSGHRTLRCGMSRSTLAWARLKSRTLRT